MNEPKAWPDQPLVESLTARELEILTHMAQHLTNQEIADSLFLSLNTVKWYARQIYGKLGVKGRRDAVSKATDLGLLGEIPATTAPILRLPAQLTPFLGRQEEMDRICSLLSGPTARLVTVVGPGGTGKTRLAIEAATCLHQTCGGAVQDGVFFVSLAPLQDPEEITSATAQAIDFQFYQSNVSLDRQLVQYLESKQVLLVLDNFEHLIIPGSIRLLTTILAEAPQVKVLATSRSRLNVQGEHTFPLAGMSVPEEDEVARWDNPVLQAEAYSSIQLFARSARRLVPSFGIHTANLPHVVRICSLVDGLPLGIELAAGWMAVLEPEQIAGEIARNLDILATGAGNVPERQQSLRAVFDSSWRLLSDPEREAFLALAAFEGGFELSAAQRVSGLSLQTLLDLVNKSWVQQSSAGHFTKRHRMPRPVAGEECEFSSGSVAKQRC